MQTVPSSVSAHPGGLNAEGCHNNRKTGSHHCHRAGGSTTQSARGYSAVGNGAFKNCDAARAAGATPVMRGDPGFGPHLDRDGDGVGCEPYRRR
ncbi:MAG TPA: excalibur calcium-binding domain-containing protein [Sphingomicrobium sp.]|nr:excalibur calcium-binding domain-containing protein [Sphingomicrobium sp.]